MAVGKAYSAGAIFLQVVPVFADIQKSIEREVEGIDRSLGDRMEKSGRKAGQRAGKAAADEFGKEFGDGTDREMTAFERSFKKTVARAGDALKGSMRENVRAIKKDLDRLGDMKIGVDISAEQALAEMRRLRGELERISSKDISIDTRLSTGKAMAELARLEAVVDKADGRNVDIKVDVDSDAAERKLWSITRSGDDASTSFRSFNLIMFAVAAAGPALIPVLGAIAGGLFAIGPAAAVAGAGLGSVLVGFSGVGEAVKALNAQQQASAMTAQTAGKKEISSANAVANARRSAARAIESALQRQADAQKRYQKSIQDVKEAEQALKEARAAAAGRGDEIGRDIRANDLAIAQARIDSFNAQVNFDATNADGSATNLDREQARIDREQALLALDNLYAKQKELAAEKAKWDKEGVNGTDEVKSAQDHLLDAIARQKDAYKDLKRAARDVDRARADGARQVAAAMQGQAAAAAAITSQQNAVNQAFEKLGPAGRDFARFLFELQTGFHQFRADVQEVLLPAVQQAISGFLGSRSAGVARRALILLAESFGRFAVALSQSFQGQAWMGFFEMLGRLGPKIQDAYGSAFISFLEAMASMLTTLAPYALRFADGLAGVMDQFARWASSKEGQDGLRSFMDYAARVGPKVIDFVVAFARAAANIAKGLADWANLTLDGITGFLDMIANMDPQLVSALAVGLVLLTTGAQTAYATMNLLMSTILLLTNPIGLIILAVVAIGGALVYLYRTNDKFRKFVKKAWNEISTAIGEAWDKYLKPALEDLWDTLQSLWKEVLQPFLSWLGPKFVDYLKFAIPILMRVWGVAIKAISWWIKNLLIPYLKAWGKIFGWLWDKVLKPGIHGIKENWKALGAAIRWTWNNVIKPVFDFFKDKVLPRLQTAFRNTVDAIGRAWDGLKGIAAAPVKFMVETVINGGLIAGFNKITDALGVGKKLHIDPIKLPGGFGSAGKASAGGGGAAGAGGVSGRAYADGGVMPGYTPGRDVHSFYSPTAGRLYLSGGEAVMRPEWTSAVGSGFVDSMNALARKGGVKAVRKALFGRFAKGGIMWPVPGHQTGTYPGHDGVDINRGSGWDDFRDPIWAVADGRVQYQGFGKGYGHSIWIDHPKLGLTTLYGHADSVNVKTGQQVKMGQLIGRVGNTGNSSAPHLHFGVYPGGTYDSALNFLRGAVSIQGATKAAGGGKSWPKAALDFARHPVETVKGLVSGPLNSFRAAFSGPFAEMAAAVPGKLLGSVTTVLRNAIPGGLLDVVGGAVGKVKDAAGAIGDSIGLANGGILPYNGTMMYDNGGYLPPGVTNVVNLTGKPEPVFTNDQWANMGRGRPGTGGETYHYEPHFEGSDVTPGEIAADMNHGFRRLRHEGKYKGL